MKLGFKIFTLIGLLCAAYISIIYITSINNSFPDLVILSILFSLLTISLTWILIEGRLRELNQKVAKISVNREKIEPLQVRRHDEFSEIEKHINQVIGKINLNEQEFDKRVDERTEQLQKTNIKLQHEVTEKNAEAQLKQRECLTQLARYDNLTSLPNRVFFNEILNKAINHAKRRNKLLAILYVDIDNFKNINLDLGHSVGDFVLKEIGNRFSNVLRSEDILAKLDGDEFIVLLNDIGKSKFAGTVSEKLLRVCAQPMKIDAHDFIVTASIGICIFPNDGSSLETLIRNTEVALQRAKANGNSYQFYTQTMDIEAHEYIQLEAALRQAIQNNELAIYYQPKLHLKKGTIVSVEALIRWTHPEFGVINPSKFIPLAEESGLIMQIGEWAFREACKTNKYWQDEGYEHITVSLNLSPKEFNHPDISDIIANVLKDTGLNPKYLELEINEATIMNDMEAAAKKLDRLKAIGLQISLDHFGTGYTSISHLKQFPISVLKIDKSFVKGIPQKPDDLAITSAVIALAHNLGLEVVAEGVETAEQVQHLASQNCDIVQGYFLSHPLPAQKIILQFKKLMDGMLL